MKGIFRYLLTFALVIVHMTLWAQVTKVIGTVTDSVSGEPLPFVNLIFKGTTTGTQTGFDGKYVFESRNVSDSLIASFVGYEKMTVKVQKGKFQVIDFRLQPTNLLLTEVVILPGENPAEIILKKVIDNKDKNDRNNLDAYQYQAYKKIQLDANNITEKFKNRRIFKPFQFIFENMDTSTINGKAYLPLFLSEEISEVYYRKSPRSHKTVIEGSQISGIRNQSITEFVSDVFQDFNIYDSYLPLFQKNFVSPLANFGLMYYRYYLVDSAFQGNKWCYKIMFKPKRKQELTFTGELWINDTTWAVKSVDMKMAEDANINFINNMVVTQEFDRISNSNWMLVKEVTVADLNIVEDAKTTMGFFGRKTTTFKDFVFNTPKENSFYNTTENIITENKALDRPESYWTESRHDSLSRDEKTIYHLIDTLKSLPQFRTWLDIIKMITTGYYVKGNYEWGPYMSIMSFNPLEGARFRVGGRTSNEFSKRVMISTHVAYGTLDQEFKYGLGFLHMLNKNPRRYYGLKYKKDIEQLGQSQTAFREDFLLAALFRKQPPDKLSMVEEYNGFYDHEWFQGFSSRFHVTHRQIYSVGNTHFYVHDPEFDSILHEQASIVTSEVGVNLHFALKEKFLEGEFERISLGAKFPILEIKYTYGIPYFLHADYEFHRLQLGLEHWFNIGALGWSKYIIEAGRIWGAVPFPLLKLHEGNETYSFDEYAFNTMNYYEFVSDRYVSAYYTHHFDGLFLNRVPLLRKLKLREVGYVKALVGNLGTYHRELAEFPAGLNVLSKPFVEMGAGIENIARILRVDAIWRMSYLDHPDITKVGVRFTLWFTF